MKLNKYSQTKDGGTTVGSYADRSSSSGNSSPNSPNPSGNLDRSLWGQDDTGDDIDGDISCAGNIYAGNVEYDDDTEEMIAPEHEFPSEQGNIFAGNSVESPQVYGNSLFLDINGVKTNILDILMPVGSVIMFNGTSEIPANWAVCDGNNGTPNLKDRFIKGVTSNADVGKTGGSSQVEIGNIIPYHTHMFHNYLTQVHGDDEIFDNDYGGEIWIDGKRMTVGKHTKNRDPTKRADTSDSGYSQIPYIYHETEGAGVQNPEASKVDIEPPFYSLIFIMRIK